MRALAQDLGVVPMALYKHVRDKDELLDGMVDVLIDEFESPDPALDWKAAIRHRLLAARGGGDPPPAAARAGGGAAPPVGPQGDRVAPPPYADRAGLHGLGHRHVPRRRLLRRPDPPPDARAGQPDLGVQPRAVRGAPGRRCPAADPRAAGRAVRRVRGALPA